MESLFAVKSCECAKKKILFEFSDLFKFGYKVFCNCDGILIHSIGSVVFAGSQKSNDKTVLELHGEQFSKETKETQLLLCYQKRFFEEMTRLEKEFSTTETFYMTLEGGMCYFVSTKVMTLSKTKAEEDIAKRSNDLFYDLLSGKIALASSLGAEYIKTMSDGLKEVLIGRQYDEKTQTYGALECIPPWLFGIFVLFILKE